MDFRGLGLPVLCALSNDVAADVEFMDAALGAAGMASDGFCFSLFHVGGHDGGDDAAFRDSDDAGVY